MPAYWRWFSGCNKRWWEGPAWLYRPRPNWPGGCKEADEEANMKEKKKQITVMSVRDDSDRWFIRFSSFLSNVRLMGWITRFINKCGKTTVV